jgi:crotonobetainyl-CoA:carnitine CoA-transferase CaiB-like acyl-CoA transferase
LLVSGVLDGVKVVEVSMWAYVPSAGAVLAEWGADVVKIEGPEGDPIRSLVVGGVQADGPTYTWEVWNRNKRGIALDLNKPEAQQIVHDLVAQADVFLTSILPGTRQKLGIDLETIRAANPGIIYAAGTGSGPLGPEAGKGGYDSISFWSRGGVSAGVTREGDDPVGMPSGAFGDSLSGMALAGGIAAALVRKARTGEGSVVEGALLATAMWAMQMAVVGTAQAGIAEMPKASSRRNAFNPLVNNYRTADDRWIALCMLQPDAYWEGLCRAIGRADLLEDPRFADSATRAQHAGDCVDELDKTFASQPLEHWRPLLLTQRGQWDVIQRAGDFSHDPQAIANGFVQTVHYEGGHTLPLVATPILFDRAANTLAPAPGFSGDADEILAGLGWDEEQILQAKISGAVV